MESTGGTFKLFHTDKVSQNKQLEQYCYDIVSVILHYFVFCPVRDKQEILEECRKRQRGPESIRLVRTRLDWENILKPILHN